MGHQDDFYSRTATRKLRPYVSNTRDKGQLYHIRHQLIYVVPEYLCYLVDIYSAFVYGIQYCVYLKRNLSCHCPELFLSQICSTVTHKKHCYMPIC